MTEDQFIRLRDAFVDALPTSTTDDGGAYIGDEPAADITLDGHFNLDLAMRKALAAVGIEPKPVYLVERQMFDPMEDDLQRAARFEIVGYVTDPANTPNRPVRPDEASWTFKHLRHKDLFRLTLLPPADAPPSS